MYTNKQQQKIHSYRNWSIGRNYSKTLFNKLSVCFEGAYKKYNPYQNHVINTITERSNSFYTLQIAVTVQMSKIPLTYFNFLWRKILEYNWWISFLFYGFTFYINDYHLEPFRVNFLLATEFVKLSVSIHILTWSTRRRRVLQQVEYKI